MKNLMRLFTRALPASVCLFALGFASAASAQNLALEAAPQEPAEEETEIAASDAPAVPEVEAGAVPDGSVGGMGDINLYPRRIVMDRRQRIASVGIYNKTPFDGEYQISITDMVMLSGGNVVPLDNLPPGAEPGDVKTASEMLRWSPRRVMLLGSEAQTVRVMARPPSELPDGEYRAHFMVVSVPTEVNDGEEGENNVGVTIRPRFGISIPVIVRIGDTTLDVGLENIGFVQSERGPLLSLTITRSGTRSAYGDIIVTVPGQSEPLVLARGIGVYPEIDSRQVQLALNPEFDLTQLQAGMQLTATFVDDDFAPGETLARQDFVVQ